MKGDSSQWIAVIGMAGRFPGARDLREFWGNLRDGVESIRFLNDDQLLRAGVKASDLKTPEYVRAVSTLDDIDLFAASFFGMSPKDAAIMDPQHRLFLECAWEALESAGWCSDQFPGRIGVYAGSGINSYLIHNLLHNRKLVDETGLFLLKQTGNDKDVLATRVSYQLDLTGPSVSVQTACSTSLVAIHLAAQGLLNRECDLALAGGVTIEIPHGQGYLYREGEILSRDGHCRAFDAESSGTIFGSGLGLVVLRRFEDALQDGDHIHAVILGSAINNDGARKVGYLAPSVAGQAEAISDALGVAELDASSISYVETHGTGTRVGDPIEIEALTRAFQKSAKSFGFCAIGSLKTNLGHLDAAAGVAGFIKTVLALERQLLPPSLNFSKPNPLIDFEKSPFFVNTELRSWERTAGIPRRAGVTSLGIGGTNAHVVLEEAPERAPSGKSRDWQLLTVSAKSAAALDAASRNLADYLRGDCSSIADVAFTCHLGRKAFPHRRAVICKEPNDATDALSARDSDRCFSHLAPDRERGLAFVFPGQGAQYTGMGRDLYETESEFRSSIDFSAQLLKPRLGLDLRAILYPKTDRSDVAPDLLNQTHITQPALFAVEYALAVLWRSWGIVPRMMIGHSIGEFTAACLAGVLTLESALEIVAERGRLMQSAAPGAMTAVMISEREIGPIIGEGVSLAAVNAEGQCVVSGPENRIARIEKDLSARGIKWHRLRVSHAFHSAMMDPILEHFAEFVDKFELFKPQIPYVSCVTGDWIADHEATDPYYWARQLRQPVRFCDGIARVLSNKGLCIVEVGPGSTQSALIEQHPAFASTHDVIASLASRRTSVSDSEAVMRALAQLWTFGQTINWHGFHAHQDRRRVPLPTYPFERRRFWIDPDERRPDANSDGTRDSGAPDLLFRKVWKRSDFPVGTNSNSPGPWLIFCDPHGLGTSLTEYLRARGEYCIEVSSGDTFVRVRNDFYILDPDDPAGYAILLHDLERTGRVPRSIVHLWSLIRLDSSAAYYNSLDEAKSLSFYSLLFLGRALGTMDVGGPVQVGVVSNCLFEADEMRVRAPERALLLGPSGAIPKEFRNVSCRNIDLDLTFDPRIDRANAIHQASAQIVTELRSRTVEPPVAYRRGRRWVRSFQSAGRNETLPINLREGGVFLITGGLGAIGLVLAKSIARSVRARLVLLSRTSLPVRDAWDDWIREHGKSDPTATKIREIREIESSGAEVLVLSADVGNEAAMRKVAAAIRDLFGPVNGIIHAAGVLADAPILEKNRSSCEEVLAPKLRGTMILESVFAHDDLDFLLLMSSVSGLITPAGQVDYGAANAFLDAFAASRSGASRTRVVAIDWPRWRELGLAADPMRERDDVHPLLGRHVNHSQPGVEFSKKLVANRDWIIDEHRLTSGTALFPATGYIEMVSAALAEQTRNRVFSIRDFEILAPIAVAPHTERSLRFLLRSQQDGYTFASFGQDKVSGEWTQSASGKVDLNDTRQLPTRHLDDIRRRCRGKELRFDVSGLNQNQGQHIEFGPRWRSLKWIRLGRGEGLAFLELPSSFANDRVTYRLHPALLDMATGSAMFLIHGYSSSSDLYVPISYEKISVEGDLPAKCYSYLRARRKPSIKDPIAVFDIDIFSEAGARLIAISGFSLRRISDPSILAAERAQPATHAVPLLGFGNGSSSPALGGRTDSISLSEGVQAFTRILAGASDANLIVFPSDFSKFIESRSNPQSIDSFEQISQRGDQANEIEATLSRWWQEILGVKQVGSRDDFFDAGGQSLAGVRLLAKIKKKYGVDLKLASLFEAPTIEKLSRLIRKAEKVESFSSVVEVRAGGVKSPLFLLHGVGGKVLGFQSLIKHLEVDQPIYGIEYSISPADPVRLRLQDLASNYVREVRMVQPNGPYYFLGYSFGGLLAYEMAQQLVAKGESVALLGMIDTYLMCGDASRGDLRTRVRSKLIGVRNLAHRACRGSDRMSYLREMITMRVQDRIGKVRQQIYAILTSHGRPIPKYLEYPRDVNWFAAKRYRPAPYPGIVTLFRASRADTEIDELYAYELGWKELALGGVNVHEVPGTHYDIIREPNVEVLARKVSRCLTEQLHASLRRPQEIGATVFGAAETESISAMPQ